MTYIKNTLFIGKVLIHIPSITSTNTYAIDLLSKSNPTEGTVITTDNQTAGRGQIGSLWESEAYKNITMSVILYPKFLNVQEQFNLHKISSIALFNLVKDCLGKENLKIKWPNDLYMKNSKLAGILIQNSLKSQLIQSTVIGIGLNVNQTQFHSNAPNPGSLSTFAGENFSLKTLIADLCFYLEKAYLNLKNGDRSTLDDQYTQNLYKYMEWAEFRDFHDKEFKGRIIGVDKLGRLQIETKDEIKQFNFKEVKFII